MVCRQENGSLGNSAGEQLLVRSASQQLRRFRPISQCRKEGDAS